MPERTKGPGCPAARASSSSSHAHEERDTSAACEVAETLTPPSTEEARRQAHLKRSENKPEVIDSDTEPDEGAAPSGAGHRGVGPPIAAGWGPYARDMRDGAGLCSPGIWPPERRRRPSASMLTALAAALKRAVERLPETAGCSAEELFDNLANGRCVQNPFPQAVVEDLRNYAAQLLAQENMAGASLPRPEDREQPVRIRLMEALLRVARDPDVNCWSAYARGVPLGVQDRLPRTPAVYERKRKWRLVEQQDANLWNTPLEELPWRENYASVRPHKEELRRQLEELVDKGLHLRLSPEEFKSRWPHGTVASLGAVTSLKDGELSVRLVFDGTHGVDVNRRIRVRDQERPPSAADAKAYLGAQAKRRRATLGLAADAKSAHRTIMVSENDWGHQAARAEDGDDVYVATCGTFGTSSIAYWWNRLASAAVRLTHYLADADDELWILLLADDFKIESSSSRPKSAVIFVLLLLTFLGIDIQWRKVQGGATIAWVGYEFRLWDHALGISESRAQWAIRFCHRVAQDGAVKVGELREGLGRLGYIAGALDFDRPFLGPIYTFVSLFPPLAVRPLPLYVASCLRYFAYRLARRRHQSMAISRTVIKDGPRVDAHAEGSSVGVGGWLPARSPAGNIVKAASKWFAVSLNRDNAPWAFAKSGEPYRAIAALEAYGALLSLIAFAPLLPADSKARLRLPGFTDNASNTFSLARLMTTKYPLLIVIMEIAIQSEARNLVLDLEWVPRDSNEEADALSRGDTTGFDPAHRVTLDLENLPLQVMNDMMKQGQELQALKQQRRAETHAPHTEARRASRPEQRLKTREPW